jgi:8-oxo-dGTP pyrophosphatase MutT (NUDIX family)
MTFDREISRIRRALTFPLPGEEAQRQMSPPGRQTMPELLKAMSSVRESSVLMLLYPDLNGRLCTLLIERPVTGHVHSGQLAFPGGKAEPSDESPAHTALRETEEEVGVPAASIEIIGQLSQLIIPASAFLVYPYIGIVESTPAFIPNTEEVKALFPVTVGELLSLPKHEKRFNTSYGIVTAPSYELHGRDLWGATAMMVSEFRVMVENAGK